MYLRNVNFLKGLKKAGLDLKGNKPKGGWVFFKPRSM